jgi:phosphohistidine phosphatase SixA
LRVVKRWIGCVLALGLVVAAGPRAAAQEVIYVVRHAERADQSADSPLSSAGATRARHLADVLKDAGITHVFTSERLRTIETAAPTAAAVQVRANQVPAAETPALAAKISALGARDRALVVGHSNTVPELLRALHVASAVTIGDEEYDNLFVVVPYLNNAPTLLRLKY